MTTTRRFLRRQGSPGRSSGGAADDGPGRENAVTLKRRTAFVFSGGGNQTVSQVGMLRALLERGVVPDVVIGTSAGALNGAVIATEPTARAVDRLAEVWLSIRSGEVFEGNRLSRAWNVLRRDDHLFANDGLRRIIARAQPAPTFDRMAVPLRVIATDLETGEEVVLANGPIEPALLASCALPGMFPPIHHDGRLLIDGAVVDSVPLWHALAGPVERVYVLNVSGGLAERHIRSPLDVVVQAFAIARNQRFELEMRHTPSDVDVIVLPAPHDDRDLFDFSDSVMLIEEAQHLAAKALDQHELHLASLRAREKARRRWFRQVTRGVSRPSAAAP